MLSRQELKEAVRGILILRTLSIVNDDAGTPGILRMKAEMETLLALSPGDPASPGDIAVREAVRSAIGDVIAEMCGGPAAPEEECGRRPCPMAA